MLNRSGVTKTSYGNVGQILANVELQASVGCIVPQSLGVVVDSKRIAKAGTPIVVNFANIGADVAAPSGPTLGVFTVQITTAFANDEKITIAGVDYVKKATESIEDKQFTGSTAADQITSLLKMVTTEKYDVAAVSGATDKLGFTQKVLDVADTTGPTVTKTSSTGAIGSVTKTATASASTTANAVLLHNVDVTGGKANGTALYVGVVNINRLDADVRAKIVPGINTVGSVSFIAV